MDAKISLPRFLKLLTSNNVPVPKAIAIAGKIYKDYNTPAKLTQLTELKLTAAGVEDKDDRRLVMAAIRKSGYGPKRTSKKHPDSVADEPIPGPSILPTMNSVDLVTTPTKKRKRLDSVNELLPDGPVDEAATYGSLEFDEILDEEILKAKSTIVNRAPMMTAWATVVAERIGFRREEALSIASVYTEMNAVSKGVSLGILEDGKQHGLEAVRGGSQPYTELMGRRPLYQTKTAQWRALSYGSPVQPSMAFSYISRAFRQTTPYVMGALKLLASSFTVQEVNNKAWGLYAEFRPAVDGWGKKSEVKCSTILNLMKGVVQPVDVVDMKRVVKFEERDEGGNDNKHGILPRQKRVKSLTLEEYEAALDQDFDYDDVSLGLEP